jgi:phosphoesterase RecJ-like protein
MSYNSIINVIKKNKRFLITTHVNPDADAIGSALAMAVVLKSLGKSVVVFNEDVVPGWLGFLPRTAWFKRPVDIKTVDYDVAIALDCGDASRIGNVRGLLRKGKVMVNIDHHKTNDSFGNVNLILPKASSTAEILYELFSKMKIRWSKELAMLVYAGIMTDTGSFRYDCTSARTHHIVGDLLDHGVSPQEVYTKIYDVVTVSDLRIFMQIANNVEFILGGKIACLELSKKDLAKFSNGFDVRDKVFAWLRSAEGVEVIVIFNEVGKSRTRVNFRSKGNFDVAKLASRFQGGGHAKASGCTLELSLQESRKKILQEITRDL